MTPGAVIALSFWGLVAVGCGYGLSLDLLRWWEDRHARKLARVMADQQGMLPEATTVGELFDQEQQMEACWPRPRSLVDPLIDELERLFEAPCAPNPRRLRS